MADKDRSKRFGGHPWRAPTSHVTVTQQEINGHLVWIAEDETGICAMSEFREEVDSHLQQHER